MEKLIGKWKSEYWKQYIDNVGEDGCDDLSELWDSCDNDESREDLLNSLIICGYDCDDIFSEIFFEQDLGDELEFDSEKGARYGDVSVTFGNTCYNLDIWNGADLEIELTSVEWIIEKKGRNKPKKQILKDILEQISPIIEGLSQYKNLLGDDLINSLKNKLKELESYKSAKQIPNCVYEFREGKPEVETTYLDASKYDINGKPYKNTTEM